MSTSPVENYQQAIITYKRAVAEMERLANIVAKVSNWRTMILANTPPDIHGDFPPSRGEVLDYNEWPDAHRLTEAYRDYHDARRSLHDAWRSLTEQQRTGLTSPEPLK